MLALNDSPIKLVKQSELGKKFVWGYWYLRLMAVN